MSYTPKVKGVLNYSDKSVPMGDRACFGNYWVSTEIEKGLTSVDFRVMVDQSITGVEKDYFVKFIQDFAGVLSKKGSHEDFFSIKNKTLKGFVVTVLINNGQKTRWLDFALWTTLFRFLQEFPEIVKSVHENQKATLEESLAQFIEIQQNDKLKLNKYNNLYGHGFKPYWKGTLRTLDQVIATFINKTNKSLHELFIRP